MGMVLQAGGVAGLVGADSDRGFLPAGIYGHRPPLAFSIRHAVWNFSVLGVGGNFSGLGGVANFGTGSLTNCRRSESLRRLKAKTDCEMASGCREREVQDEKQIPRRMAAPFVPQGRRDDKSARADRRQGSQRGAYGAGEAAHWRRLERGSSIKRKLRAFTPTGGDWPRPYEGKSSGKAASIRRTPKRAAQEQILQQPVEGTTASYGRRVGVREPWRRRV